MATSRVVYLFGDQSTQSRDDLRALLLFGGNSVLNTFIDEATQLIRREIQSLPWSMRENFPAFAHFLDLLALDASKLQHPPLQLALSSFHQFASYILQRSSELGSYVAADTNYTFGYGTGQLTAAAVACYPVPDKLIPVALEIIRISFRMGLLTSDSRDHINGDGASSASWRIRVELCDTEVVSRQLEDFCARKQLSTWSKPYVCGVSPDSILIAGIPAFLTEFINTYDLNASKLPVYAPFHASHIFSNDYVTRLVDLFSPPGLLDAPSKFTLFSHPDGRAQSAQTLGSHLTSAVKAILREPLPSGEILDFIKDTVKTDVSQKYTVISIGTNRGSKLAALIEGNGNSGVEVNYLDDLAIMNSNSGSARPSQSKIAITGFSGRFPKAENVDKFWEVIHGGVDTHSVTPPTRWDIATHVDPSGKKKNTSGTQYGCWLDNPGHFDRSFFMISPREAPQMDPAQRLALMSAYEAIEMAGIVPDATPSTMKSRVGVFIGVTSNDWCETNSAQNVDFYFIPGGNRAFIPGRINYYFKFSGPSFSVDTACSSSLAAIHLACNALWRKEIDTAIVGGTNILSNPDVTAGLDRGHFLSRTGNCKSFDDGADGYCRGEGVGIVILKRLEDAQAEKDPIHGCILSAATNHSAEAESITRPHVGAQQALFSQILAKAGVHQNEISYVEMHGTGTQAGDGREMSSVVTTFAPWAPGDPRGRDTDLHVGSVKANVGHGESVSGVTALIKVLLMMQNNEIPPHCGIKTKINQTFPSDLNERRIKIASKPVPWPRSNKPRRVLVNNFSAAGGNSGILIEDAPERVVANQRPDTRPAHVLTVSAKSQTALESNVRSMAQFLKTSAVSLPDLAYTSTARRVHYNFRLSYVGQTIQDLSNQLEQDVVSLPQQFKGPPKIVFAFAGQGSNHAGMGKDLYFTNATFRRHINRFDSIIQEQGFGSILPYIRDIEGAAQSASPMTVQLAHLSLQMALSRLWQSWGVVPAAVLGHSLGEYAALNYAGVLSDFDVLWICGQRAKLLAEHCQVGTHAMLATRSPYYEVTSKLDGPTVEIACINSLHETVISGTNVDIDMASQQLELKGIRCNRINVPYAFHSSQLDPILGHFSKVLDGITLRSPTKPVLSPFTSKVYNTTDEIGKDYLLGQCREAVNLVGAVRAAHSAAIMDERTHVIEIGPSLILGRLMQRTVQRPLTVIPSLDPKQNPWIVLSKSVALAYRVGCNVNWAQYHRDYDHSVIQLPSYGWDLKNYWLQYVNDWSLRKGDPLPVAQAPTPRRQLEIATTSCQKLISSVFNGDNVHAVIESDLQSKDLRGMVAGHRVNGIAVCIGAVYADMAVSAAKSILQCFPHDTANTALLIKDMNMQEALVINDTPEAQIVRIEASCDWKKKKVDVEISSADKSGKARKIHSKATVVFADRQAEMENLQQTMLSTGSQIETLKNSVASGLAERFSCSMAYKMVASLAHYDASHKGVKQCSLNSTTLEACALVSHPVEDRLLGVFTLNPCVFDAILQPATFVMNANENAKFDQEVYVVRGWDSVFLNAAVTPENDYEAYVKMTARDKDVSVGDIVVMHRNNLVGCLQGVRVQRVPRRLMDVMFKPKATTEPARTTSAKIPAMQIESGKAQPKNVVTAPKVVSAPTVSVQVSTIQTTLAKPVGDSPLVDKALSIVAEESGIAKDELKDEDLLSDVGIDSLLVLVIAGRFREELMLDLQPNFFAEVGSIGGIKAFLNAQNSSTESTTVQTEIKAAPPVVIVTPQQVEITVAQPAASVTASVSNEGTSSKVDTALTIVAEESGIAKDELKDEDLLSDIGIDSLLILVIAGRFREELELDLQPNFFAEVGSIGGIKAYLNGQASPASVDQVEDEGSSPSGSVSMGTATPVSRGTSTPASSASDDDELPQPQLKEKMRDAIVKMMPKSTSILLQGTLGANTKTMFMFPDGSGSATSYMHLPRVHEDVAVIGLNCPYMTKPKQMPHDAFEGIAEVLLTEVRRRQPKGPYYFGGWSAGGAFAFCAAKMLIDAGEEVKSLLLIDAPCPIGLGKLPQAFFDYWRTIHQPGGVVQDRPLPAWLMDHFQAVNANLRGYTATPFPRGRSPKTYITWAALGTDNLAGFTGRHLLTAEESRDIGFLMDDKTEFGTRGWEKLLEGELTIEKAMMSNHFTIVRGEGAKILSSLIKRACITG